MAYQSLYRTYRPQSFLEVAGQRLIVQTLRNALIQGQIAHAYLFSGPRGTGKTSIAKILAKGVNCTGAGEKPCNTCPSCLAANNNSHPDIIEVDAASNNGVDEIRSLIDRVKYVPTLGQKKVYIIDEVHMLSTSAFNAFLKTLEEPPAHVLFILATTEPQKILPTILSRCQRFDFAKVEGEALKQRLVQIFTQEEISYDQSVLDLISDLAEGGMRDALSIADQLRAYAGAKITADAVREVYGIATTGDKLDFLKAVVNKDFNTARTLLATFSDKGLDLSRFTADLLVILKEICVYQMTLELDSFYHIPAEIGPDCAATISKEMGLFLISRLLETSELFKKINNPQLILELALFQIYASSETASLPPAPPVLPPTPPTPPAPKVQAPRARPAPTTPKAEAAPPPPPTPVPDKPARLGPVSDDVVINIMAQGDKQRRKEVTEAWQKIALTYSVDPRYMQVSGYVVDAKVLAVSANALVLTYRHKLPLDTALQPNVYRQILTFVKEVTGSDYLVYPVTEADGVRLTQQFLSLLEAGKLPKPTPIIPLLPEADAPEATTLETLFGDLYQE